MTTTSITTKDKQSECKFSPKTKETLLTLAKKLVEEEDEKDGTSSGQYNYTCKAKNKINAHLGDHSMTDEQKEGNRSFSVISASMFDKKSNEDEITGLILSFSDEEQDNVDKKCLEYGAMANNRVKQGDFKGAIKLYSLAISLNNEDFRFFCNRSFCYEHLKQYKLALSDADQAIRLLPFRPKPHFMRGKALIGLRRYEEAEREFKLAEKMDPDCRDYHEEMVKLRNKAFSELGFQKEESFIAAQRYNSIQDAIEALLQNSKQLNADSSSKFHRCNPQQQQLLHQQQSYKHQYAQSYLHHHQYQHQYQCHHQRYHQQQQNQFAHQHTHSCHNNKQFQHHLQKQNAHSFQQHQSNENQFNRSRGNHHRSLSVMTRTRSKSRYRHQSPIACGSTQYFKIFRPSNIKKQKLDIRRSASLDSFATSYQYRNKLAEVEAKAPINIFGYKAIWIGNVDPRCSSERLHEVFGKYGHISVTNIVPESFCAFVCFDNPRSPCAAIADLYNKVIYGISNGNRCLKFRFAPGKDQDKNYHKTARRESTSECYFWRTTGCTSGDKCKRLHLPICRGIDFQPWMSKKQ
ncbi:LON peptidase N-terminal domain and RING finger protein 1-like protein [Dinothrombium tinctorium]|uniref:LON peptidase N-terminal domain and RING finger protein 1-like protein n=1 Tax=Dinothrombium tinctorium TaxID=1965070 RepID=A0A3S4QQH2_9ACAR|nr:LON peptidase N-terminal domain and RING finger protein 1-like protein [Dinothrombium tinctorium]